MPPLDQYRAAIQEYTGDIHSRRQQTAAIVPQVYEISLRAFLSQIGDGLFHFAARSLGERVNGNVAYGGACGRRARNHVRLYRWNLDHAARDGEFHLLAIAQHGDAHTAARIAAHTRSDVVEVGLIGQHDAINANQDIARQDAGQLGWGIGLRREYDLAIVVLAQVHANPTELPAQLIAFRSPRLRLDEDRPAII